eukprot:tig00020553_g10750.t1
MRKIIDTGPGIAKEHQIQLFQRFYRVQHVSRSQNDPGGTGLGLAISREIVEKAGGRIGCLSNAGEGCTFWFELPCRYERAPTRTNSVLIEGQGALHSADGALRTSIIHHRQSSFPSDGSQLDESGAAGETTERPSVCGSTAPPLGCSLPPMDILVAEDNAMSARVVTSMLKKEGHRVTLVQNGAEAVQRFAEATAGAAPGAAAYGIVFMDCLMPVMDGYEATGAIRALEAERRLARHFVVALTAKASSEDEQECLRAGMDRYLPKPVRRATLAAMLEERAAMLQGATAADRRAFRRPFFEPVETIVEADFPPSGAASRRGSLALAPVERRGSAVATDRERRGSELGAEASAAAAVPGSLAAAAPGEEAAPAPGPAWVPAPLQLLSEARLEGDGERREGPAAPADPAPPAAADRLATPPTPAPGRPQSFPKSRTRSFGARPAGSPRSSEALAHHHVPPAVAAAAAADGASLGGTGSTPASPGGCAALAHFASDSMRRASHANPLDLLVVDDVEMNRRVLVALLSKEGHRVEVACDGQEAVDIFERRAREALAAEREGNAPPDREPRPVFDCVFMDISMPVMDGYAATRRIRHLEKSLALPVPTPVVACTALSSSDDREHMTEAGMDDLVVKPVGRAKIFGALAKWAKRGGYANPYEGSRRGGHPAPLAERPLSSGDES